MQFRVYQHWWLPNLYFADLLGGEFANCYGQGNSREAAVTSLKIRLHQLRRKI